MITAVFYESDTARASGLWQWDYGQVLRIQGLSLPTAVEIHFSLQESVGESDPRIGVTNDGVTDVPIPDSMLENGGATQDYYIYAWVYLSDETSGETIKHIKMPVKTRPKPHAFSRPEDADLFREAIAAVNKSAMEAQNAEKSAEAWTHGSEDYPDRDEDNAAYYAGVAGENAGSSHDSMVETQHLAERVHSDADTTEQNTSMAEQYKSQAAQSAADALQSKQNAKTSETAAQEAQAGAETAEGQAELFAAQAEEDKNTVEQAKAVVMEIGQKVADNKKTVEQTVDNFELLHEQAVADINNAGKAQTERVNEAGETAVDNIELSRQQAAQSVTNEGAAQVANVQAAAEEITGKAEQIDKNTQGITELKGDLSQLSEEIVTISGSINPFTMTALNLFDDLEFLGKTYNGATSGLTIYNQETYTKTSEISNWSKAIPIRDSKGRQLFSFKWHKLDKAYNATIAVYFDVDGNYHSTIPMNTNTPDDIPNDVYYVSFVKYNNVGNYIVRDKVGVEWINANGERAYHVGTNGDYPTLTSALIGLKNDTSEKVIYIESGSYNIFEEMGGADYFDSLPEISNLSEWRTYCNLIPANTKIIGVGYVELNFNYGLTRINQGIFSCLNATTGTHIENVIINQTGGRYAIHFEGGTGANTNGNVYTLKNVIVNADIINPSIGVGTNVNSEIIIDNCVINNGVNTRPVFYHHTNHHGKGLILIKDSILHGQVDLQNWANATNGTNGVIVNIINSYVRVLKVFAVNSEVTVSDYTINVFGTNEYELISTNVTPLVNKFS